MRRPGTGEATGGGAAAGGPLAVHDTRASACLEGGREGGGGSAGEKGGKAEWSAALRGWLLGSRLFTDSEKASVCVPCEGGCRAVASQGTSWVVLNGASRELNATP